jgi:hypothetical protein
MDTKISTIFTLISFCPPLSHWCPPPDRTCFTFLSFVFFLKTFLSVYGSYTGGFIVTFPYIHELVHPPTNYSFYPSLLLVVTSTGFSDPYSHMYRKHLSHIHPPNSALLLASPIYAPILHHLGSAYCSVRILPGYFTCKYIMLKSV